MQDISMGAAIGAGFRLIRREPLALLAWSAVYFAFGVLPSLWLASQMLPLYVQMFSGDFNPASPEFAQLQAQANGAQLACWIASLLAQTLIAGAVFRAALQPEARKFLYLRLSGQEGWLGLCVLVLIVLGFIAMLVVMLPLSIVFAIVMVAAGGGGAAGGVLAGALIVLVALTALTWALLRMSMGPLMSFSERNLRLFESWTFTRGHAWKMFLVGLALVGITLLAEIVLVIAGAIVVNAIVPLASIRDAFADDPQAVIRRLAPVWVVSIFVVTPLGTALYVLFAAAWAEMYRQLAYREADVF